MLLVAFSITLFVSVAAGQDAVSDEKSDELPVRVDHATRVLMEAVGSDDWLFRALAAMRLETSTRADAAELLERLRSDPNWYVRAFAVRTIARRPDGAATLEGLTDDNPRVIRIGMLYSVTPEPETLRTHVQTLLGAQSLESVVLGIELAAMCDDVEVQRLGYRAIERTIGNMNATQAAYLTSRLAAACGLNERASVHHWRTWLAEVASGKAQKIDPRAALRERNAVESEIVDAPEAATEAQPDSDAKDPETAEGEETAPVAPPTIRITDMDDEAFMLFVQDYLRPMKGLPLELVVCIDTSGSMGPEIAAARRGVDRLFGFLRSVCADVRVGLVGYCDVSTPLAGVRLSRELKPVREALWSLQISGGDEPVAAAIRAAIEGNSWTDEAARVVIVVGDEPFREENRNGLRHFLVDARRDGFTVHTVKSIAADLRKRYPEWVFLPQWDDIATWGGGQSVNLDQADDIIGHIIALTIGGGWGDQIDDLLAAYAECIP